MSWFSSRGSDASLEALVEQIRWLQRAFESERKEKEFYRDGLLARMGVVDSTYPPIQAGIPPLGVADEGGEDSGEPLGKFQSIGILRHRSEARQRRAARDAQRSENPVHEAEE